MRFSVADWMRPYRHQRRHAFRYSPKAQDTFKALLIHGILQFTKIITLRCALHRCSSRGIHRWKLWYIQHAHTNLWRFNRKAVWAKQTVAPTKQQDHTASVHLPSSFHMKATLCSTSPRSSHNKFQVMDIGCVRMILPQVHLRKPCYDFSFL